MKSLACESIRKACFNLERLSHSFRLARPEFCLWSDFGTALDAKLFIYWTGYINYYNVFCEQFDRNEYFSRFELSSPAIRSASESIQPVLIIWVGLNSNIRFGSWKGRHLNRALEIQSISLPRPHFPKETVMNTSAHDFLYNMHSRSIYNNTTWLKLLISVMKSKKAHLKLTKCNTPTVSTLFSLCWSHVSNWFVLLTRIPDFYRSWQMKN